MLTMFFKEGEITSFQDLNNVDLDMFSKYFQGCLSKGIYLAPSQYECMFPSAVHSEQDIEETLSVHYDVLKSLH